MPVTKRCVICGRHFEATPSWGQLRDTCSKSCRYALTASRLRVRENRICPQCGRVFSIYPSSKKRLCSTHCRKAYMSRLFCGRRNPNWRPASERRPSNKRSLRKDIRRRDRICQDCSVIDHLQVHHVDCNPLNNGDGNLILLCKSCHAKRHAELGQPELVTLILANRAYSTNEPRQCPICHEFFVPKRRKQLTCSPGCGKKLSGRTRTARGG